MTDPTPEVSPRTRRGFPTAGVLLVLTALAYILIRRSVPFSWDGTWTVAGATGLFAGLAYRHRFRGLGFVPIALTGAAAAGVWAAVDGWGQVTVAVASSLLGLAIIRLALYLDRFRRGTGLVACLLFAAVALTLTYFTSVRWQTGRGRPAPDPVWWFAAFTGLLAVFAWVRLFRPAFELLVEPVVRAMYRIRPPGPGVAAFPAGGPCLVVANHACWFDPIFLMKVLPRPVTPMMTSTFYDIRALRWLMERVFHAIRVPDVNYRRDAPELDEAIAALDRGECVVIFPEGSLRRSEERPLKRFGQGVWHILAARPETPVVACWIEGGWGSYTSYRGGKPTKNKRPDVRRRIGVAVATPVTVAADTLAQPYGTRLAVMNLVADARKLLGLPELPPFALPEKAAEEEI